MSKQSHWIHQSDWMERIVAAALNGDSRAVQKELEVDVESLVELGISISEALHWADRIAALLGTGVKLPPLQ